jgi:uncharacterized protein YggE
MTITVPTRAAVLIAAAATALALGGAYVAGDAHASGPSTLVSQSTPEAKDQGVKVSGLGRVTGVPDVLRLRLGVNARRGDVDAALSTANAALSKVRDSLRKNGVTAKDLQTSGLSIQPTYSSKGAITGYDVSESLTANLRDIPHAGHAISAAAAAGGNAVRINDISFDLEGDAKLLETARSQAFADAKAKAKQYADAAGRELGAIVSVSEVVAQPPSPYRYDYGLAGSLSKLSAVPIQAGTQDVTVTVTTLWSLK